MPPILSLVIQPLVHHFHDFDKVAPDSSVMSYLKANYECALVVGHLSNLIHLSTGRTPWIVGRCISNLCLTYQLVD